MRDLMANGYRAGGNAKFFGMKGGTFDIARAREEIGTRLNFEADAGDDPIYASLLAFPMSSRQSETIHNEITVTSRLLPWETHNPDAHKGFPGGKTMYNFYKSALGLDQVKIHTQNGNHAQISKTGNLTPTPPIQVHYGEDLRASQNMEYMSQVRLCPVLEHAHGLFVACNRPTDPLSCVHRARRTTRSASPARTAPSTRSPAPSRPSALARATGAPMPARAVRSHPRRRTPIPSLALCLRSQTATPCVHCRAAFRCPLASWRVGLDAVGTRADAQLRAGPVHWPHQDLGAHLAEQQQDSDAQVGPSSREGSASQDRWGRETHTEERRIQVSSTRFSHFQNVPSLH